MTYIYKKMYKIYKMFKTLKSKYPTDQKKLIERGKNLVRLD